MPQISFQNHLEEFVPPFQEQIIIQWVNKVIVSEGFFLSELSLVFTDDESLYKINKTYLNHDNYTDIITFDYSEQAKEINGEIIISIERVEENANSFDVTFGNEFARVMIHGVLHLLGYGDKTENQKSIMRQKENSYISLLQN